MHLWVKHLQKIEVMAWVLMSTESCYTYYELKFTMYIKSIMVDTEWLCSLIQVPMEHLVLESKAQICFEMHKCTTFSYCYLW